MMNRVWLAAAVGGAVSWAGACAHKAPLLPPPPSYTVDCTATADSTRIRLLDVANNLLFGNPGHARGAPALRGRIPGGQAPLRAFLVFEDPRGTTQHGPPADIVPEERSNTLPPPALNSGQIIGKVWLGADFKRDPDQDSLFVPAGTSYIAACVPQGTQDGEPISGLIIPEAIPSTGDTLIPIKGTYYTKRRSGGLSWAVWQSSSKSGMCIACGHGWCQF